MRRELITVVFEYLMQIRLHLVNFRCDFFGVSFYKIIPKFIVIHHRSLSVPTESAAFVVLFLQLIQMPVGLLPAVGSVPLATSVTVADVPVGVYYEIIISVRI